MWEDIRNDFAKSRRFQVFFFLSLTGMLLWFIGAMFLAYYDASDAAFPSYRSFHAHYPEIPFPSFALETTGQQDSITDIKCSSWNSTFTPLNCIPQQLQGQSCVRIVGSAMQALDQRGKRQLNCTFTAQYFNSRNDNAFALTIDEGTSASEQVVYANKLIRLDVFPRAFVDDKGSLSFEYKVTPVYIGSEFSAAAIELIVNMAEFDVIGFAPFNAFPMWLVVSSWGGLFTFFLLVVLGIYNLSKLCLPNDSTVFGKVSPTSTTTSSSFENV